MSVINTNIRKQPLKLIEVPLVKFGEEVIPHHKNIYEQHRTLILRLISENSVKLVQQEIKQKKRVIKQLKDLMYELDTLRAQVEDADLDNFDNKTLSFRKIIITLISGYTDLEKRSIALENWQIEEEEKLLDRTCPFEGAPQLQTHEGLDELKLRQRQELLDEVENVQRDAEDLNEMFTQINHMVNEQKQQVDVVEERVESAGGNVQSGVRQLIKAHKLKTAVYPVTGAFIGSMIGGPIGLVAGLKIGGLAALGCAIVGYTGGTLVKKNWKVKEPQAAIGDSSSDGQEGQGTTEKKHI